jgi:glutamine synthetase
VEEAARRGLPNLRRTPEAAAELVSEQSRALLNGLGILDQAELESRYHVRIERYVKDMLIELHTLEQIAETMILPAAYRYLSGLADGAAQAKVAGVNAAPLVAAANRAADMVAALQKAHDALETTIAKAESLHDSPDEQARFLTADGANAMAEVRNAADALEVTIADAEWPLPKYREMLFPV